MKSVLHYTTETAAHLIDHLFPQVPLRQWIMTFPRHLRYFLHRDPAVSQREQRWFSDRNPCRSAIVEANNDLAEGRLPLFDR